METHGKSDARWRILYCGIDLTPFSNSIDTVAVRAELNIPIDAFVLGHVGRFAEQKNHTFLVDIAAEVARLEPRMRLLLVGDGPLRPAIEQKIAQKGLADRVIFAGLRSDVPRLMLGGMDVFVFPSHYEGLPVAGMEVQAAGLPFILSDVIAEEIDEVRPLIRRISLSQPASVWAKSILAMQNARSAIAQADALSIIEKSPFNINLGIAMLREVYACQ